VATRDRDSVATRDRDSVATRDRDSVATRDRDSSGRGSVSPWQPDRGEHWCL
jgi:hypothetical protein